MYPEFGDLKKKYYSEWYRGWDKLVWGIKNKKTKKKHDVLFLVDPLNLWEIKFTA